MHIIKKALLPIVIVSILLGGALAATNIYLKNNTPSIVLDIYGDTLKPKDIDWHVPIARGLFYLPGKGEEDRAEKDFGEVKGSQLTLSVEEPFTLSIVIKDESGESVFEGDMLAFEEFKTNNSGNYHFEVTANLPQKEKKSYGTFEYGFTVKLLPEPKITVGELNVIQGDVFPIQVVNMPEGVMPTVASDLGFSAFTQNDGFFSAFVPVGYMKPTGGYKVTVTAGDVVEEFNVQVEPGEFKKQYLTIDSSNPVISEASSPKAYAQYREAMQPLYETSDEKMYWDGKFTQPVQGRITTEFGLLRYTNGGTTPRGHSGIDIANKTGTPIISPAPGRVVFAEYLLNTGNTLVIEHGGGLKSYFYHMDSLSVKEGDQLTQGQEVGTVGTTGYSTGPHLHYDIRIGDQSLNPWNLWNGTGGFFTVN